MDENGAVNISFTAQNQFYKKIQTGTTNMENVISHTGTKILIIDDDDGVVAPLEFLLKHSGYTVKTAQSGEDALQMVSAFMPHIVLLDILLPSIDGFEICQRIRENIRYREIKIIFLSAMVRDVDIAKGLALGADAYITKPFSNAELMNTLKKLLNGIKNGNTE